MNKLTAVFILLISFLDSKAQPLMEDSTIWNVEIDWPVAYVDADNRYYGCQLNVDCLDLRIFFRNTNIDKASHTISFDAYIESVSGPPGSDTTGSNFFQVFTAVPKGKRLRKKHLIASVRNDSVKKGPGVLIWLKAGHVFAKVHIRRRERLYILSASQYKLLEFDLPRLFTRPSIK